MRKLAGVCLAALVLSLAFGTPAYAKKKCSGFSVCQVKNALKKTNIQIYGSGERGGGMGKNDTDKPKEASEKKKNPNNSGAAETQQQEQQQQRYRLFWQRQEQRRREMRQWDQQWWD